MHLGKTSSNITTIGEDQLFEKMTSAFKSATATPTNLAEILQEINLLHESVSKPSFAERFQKLVSLSADSMTILTLFMPALTQLLTSSLGG